MDTISEWLSSKRVPLRCLYVSQVVTIIGERLFGVWLEVSFRTFCEFRMIL